MIHQSNIMKNKLDLEFIIGIILILLTAGSILKFILYLINN
jgi:hypothetical protein